MDEVSKAQNINAHYTTSAKVVKPKHVVVEGPDSIPKYHTYTDREANIRLAVINNDVYEEIKKTPKKEKRKKFLGIF